MKHTFFRPLAATVATVGAFIFILSVPAARAITISPPSLEFGVQPGQQAGLDVKVYNEDTTQAIIVTSETTSWTAGATPGEPDFQSGNDVGDVAKWIHVASGPFTLQPQGRLDVPVTVVVPEGTPAGGYYGAILFTYKNANAPSGGQVIIDSKIASLFLIRVDGSALVEAGTIQSFQVTGGTTSFQHLPVRFTTVLQNTGNIHLRPKGAITITNSFGKVVATIDFNTEKGATLPKTSRTYSSEIWQVGTVQPVSGNAWNQFWTAYHNERSNFAMGKFSAKVALTAGSVKPITLSATTTFWVIPWHIVIVYGIVAIAIIILLIFLIRWYNGWIRKKATPKPTETPQE